MGTIGCAFAGMAVAAALWTVWTFNRLIRRRNLLREAWSGIDVQLKRRHDLIPNLVDCVKGYQAHERSLLEDLTRARAAGAGTWEGAREVSATENSVSRNLRELVAVAEAYPDLKADANFRQLSASLVEVEDNLQYARRYYNGTVRDYNILAESVPSNLLARATGFQSAAFFEVESAMDRNAPEVKL